MREIKFRVWHLDDGMLFFDFDTFKKDYHDQYGNIMQFTGLKDKNGVDIYEGDKLRSRDEIMIIDGSDKYLHYDYYSFIYTVMYSESHSGLNGETRNDIQVIGNIHESKI